MNFKYLVILSTVVLLSVPTYANECKMPQGMLIPNNCEPHQWPDVCKYNGQLTWADNGLPVPGGVMNYMLVDMDAIPIVPCHWPGFRTKPNAD
jgi:hypothetical protein